MNLTPFRCSWINDQGWWLGVRFAVGAVLWLVLSSPETIFGQAPGAKSTGSRAPIKEVASILALPGGEAASNVPVKIQGVITFFQPRADLCFVQDATAGIYVYAVDPKIDLT